MHACTSLCSRVPRSLWGVQEHGIWNVCGQLVGQDMSCDSLCQQHAPDMLACSWAQKLSAS